MLNIKRNLFNIDFGSPLWTCLISAYICYLDTNCFSIKLQNIEKYSRTLKEKLKEINLSIEDIDNNNNFTELKNRRLLDDLKSTKLKINDDLCRMAQLELSKINLEIKKVVYDEDLVFKFKDVSSPNQEVFNSTKELELKNEVENYLEKYKQFCECTLNKNNGLYPENVVMLIDMREKGQNNENIRVEIINKLRLPIKIEEKQLSVGDYTWAYNDPLNNKLYMIDLLIERKTLNDLASSIIDGRYNEQKYRIKKYGYKNAYYLFEGTELSANEYLGKGNLNKDAINTAIYNTINIHNLNIIRTSGTKETINKLIEFDRRIKQGFKFLEVNGKKVTFEEFNESFLKTKNASVKEIFYRQLRCLPNCGTKTLETLGGFFRTPLSLFEFLRAVGEEKDEVESGSLEDFVGVLEELREDGGEINASNFLQKIKDIDKSKGSKRNKSEKKMKSARKLNKNFIEKIFDFYGFKECKIKENNSNRDNDI